MSKALNFKCIKTTVVELMKDILYFEEEFGSAPLFRWPTNHRKNRPVSKWCHLHHGLGHQKPESNVESTLQTVCDTEKIS